MLQTTCKKLHRLGMPMINAEFQWKCEPKAELLVLKLLEDALRENPFIEALRHDLLKRTSTRLFDWVDYVSIGAAPAIIAELEETGFSVDHAAPTYRVFRHLRAQLPRVVVKDNDKSRIEIAIAVESIADFLLVRGMSCSIEGEPLSSFRRCLVSSENGVSLFVLERRGTQSIEPSILEESYLRRYLDAVEKWETRPRRLHDEDEGMAKTIEVAEEIIELVGRDIAASIVLECERKYWQSRNTAGQIQKNRQDRLGMGWANHDHHTFRSSRHRFSQLVRLFEMLGFHCRERFYAGEEAGWGAQVMENPNGKFVLFLDVDLAPHEIGIDFAHQKLPELPQLGTIGLWCALHGDSILQAGMHHLEAQFLFEELTHDLGTCGIGMMEPFSHFPYLKQAFTHGEVWQIEPERIRRLQTAGLITDEQAIKFSTYGGVGSHLENLQRREGYKGFNQKNVSFIIKKTDPRNL